jgi:hypothetical protein
LKSDRVKTESLNSTEMSKAEQSTSDVITKHDEPEASESAAKETNSGEPDTEDGVLNLVKVKRCEAENPDVQTSTNNDTSKTEQEPSAADVKSEDNAESKPVKELTINKEDDDDTLSESEAAKDTDVPIDIKQTPPRVLDNEPEGTPLTRDEIDDDMLDRSAVTSPCPEVGNGYFVV